MTIKDAIARTVRSYNFSFNPSKLKPRDACLCITKVCNSRCITCKSWKVSLGHGKLGDLLGWISEFNDYGVKGISISGGEPTLSPNLDFITGHAKKLGLFVGIGTNGQVFNEFKNVDSVTVSIDGDKPETHDKIRGVNGSYWRAMNTARHLARLRPVYLNFVVQKYNYREIFNFVTYAKTLGFKVNLLPISLSGFSQVNAPNLKQFDVKLLEKNFYFAYETGAVINSREFLNMVIEKLKTPFDHPCLLRKIRFLVDVDGSVYPCSCWPHPIGNLKERDLASIIRGFDNPLEWVCPYSNYCLSQELDSVIRERFNYQIRLVGKRLWSRIRSAL